VAVVHYHGAARLHDAQRIQHVAERARVPARSGKQNV
jgi:hypothetical protein